MEGLFQKKLQENQIHENIIPFKITNMAFLKASNTQYYQHLQKGSKTLMKKSMKEKDICVGSKRCKCSHQTKISEMFFIKSINLINKPKICKENIDLIFNQQSKKLAERKNSVKQGSRIYHLPTQPFKSNNLLNHNDIRPSYNQRQSNSLALPQSNHNLQIHTNYNTKGQTYLRLQQNIGLSTKDTLFQLKYRKVWKQLEKVGETHKMEIYNIDYKTQLKFWCGKGNNSRLVKQLMKRRWWWIITQDKNSNDVNFIWTQLKDKQYYSYVGRTSSKSNDSLITESSQAQINSSQSKRTQKSQRVSNSIEGKTDSQKNLKMKVKKNNLGAENIVMHNHYLHNQFLGNKKALFYNMKSYYKAINDDPFKYIPLTFHVSSTNDQQFKDFVKVYMEQLQKNKRKRLWILKPGQNSNRGKGITIHSQLTEIQSLIQNLPKPQLSNIPKTYIIQSYIQKPFLYNRRKFDIRCYIMLSSLNSSIKGYWYQQGYIRTSCFQFSLDSFTNSFVHLTNDAIQKNCEQYGKYQLGNKLSFQNFRKYLTKFNKKYDFDQQIYTKIRKIAIDSIRASYQMLAGKNRKTVFEIFGLDFMIDDNFQPWLIQVNTNPCLETTCPVLQKIIPKMLDDAFRLTIDPIFPPPAQWPSSKKHALSYTHNMFQLVFDEDQQALSRNKMYQVEGIGEIEEDDQLYEEQQ